MLHLENSQLRLSFCKQSGAIAEFTDKARGITYIDRKRLETGTPPYRLDTGGGLKDGGGALTMCAVDADTATLRWQTAEGIVLRAQVRLEGAEARFRLATKNPAAATIHAVEYPILGGLHRIAGQGRDFLAHPYATGLLLEDPLIHLSHDGQGLRYMPYPESFSGCAAQFFTYYGQGKGGLYFAAYDGGYNLKWLNFHRMGWGLEASHILGANDLSAGNAPAMEYDFAVRATAGAGWHEAADIYREWAVRQSWCRKGPLAERSGDDKAQWLLEKVGACTFGINAMHDRTPWLKRYHEDIGVPIFHVLGPDWTNTPQTFGDGVPGGYNDWVPTRFCRENLETIRRQGDYAAPFEFDFLVDLGKDDSENLAKNLMDFPKGKSFDDYHFKILCPATEYTKDLHRRRDTAIVGESGVDAMYYDISANNLMMACKDPGHGHPVGGSREINRGFKTVYQDTKQAMGGQEKKYIPIGTELMNEIFLDNLDYYQARSWAQPSSSLEFWPVRHLLVSGAACVIPLFSYVYSGYGPVRMDGWGKLVEETGELFYHIVSRIYLWGGLYEINHEYSSMEALDGKTNSPEEHYFHFAPVDYAYSPRRAAYLRQYAAFRTGRANRYLAYGVMLPEPESNVGLVEMDYYHYNHGETDASYNTGGTAKVPPVVISAWRSADGQSHAVMLANSSSREQAVNLVLDTTVYGMADAPRATLYSSFDPGREPIARALGQLGGEKIPLSLTLSSRGLYLLELEPNA